MPRSLTFDHRPDGTTVLSLENESVHGATPLPRALVVDGHHPRPHPDVSAVISWLVWPRYFSGTIAFGAPLTHDMGRTLGLMPPHFQVTPYAMDRKLVPRSGGSTELALEAAPAMPKSDQKENPSREIRINVLNIEQWRGRLMSKSSVYMCANTVYVGGHAWPIRGVDLAARLAVSLLFVDALQVGRISVDSQMLDARWTAVANELFSAIGIELIETVADFAEGSVCDD